MTDPKQTIFTITDSRPLGLLDEVAAELGGDREEALGHILDLAQTARAMVPIIPPPTSTREFDPIDGWEPSDELWAEALASVTP
jgi:hypothetical protein